MMAALLDARVPLAFAAGLATIAAPCILPMLPILLGSAIGQQSRARPACIALGFVLAFSGCALVFGAFSEALGLSQQTLRDAAIVLLLVFGMLMLYQRPFDWLALRLHGAVNRVSRIGDRAGNGKLGGLVVGMTLGAVWTPCAGPMLGAILTLVATAQELRFAAVLLISYALGAGVPMLLIAYGGQHLTTRVRGIARHAETIRRVFGAGIMASAVAMYFQYDVLIAAWLSGGFAA